MRYLLTHFPVLVLLVCGRVDADQSQPAPLSPPAALDSIHVRPGFRVELAAAEPLVMDPIAIDWGADGRLWVVEMADYPLGIDDKGIPAGRVRFLRDTDHDGEYDESTLFLDGIPFPTGVMAWRDGVLVSAAPDTFYAEDTDGDGKADKREVLYRGFVEGNQQHRINGFEYGLDNWLYMANGDSGGIVESVKTGEKVDIRGRDLRIRPDTGELDAQSGGTQFGRHRDDHGHWFGCANWLPVRHYVLADHYLRRNASITPISARRDIARYDQTQIYPRSALLSHYAASIKPNSGEPSRFTSACSTSVYRDSLFGDEFYGDTFTCEPVHNLVHRRKLVSNGISFESVRPADDSKSEFLASTDAWFRPTTVTAGPDGALWIVDMYRFVIEHPEWIDDEVEQKLFLRAGNDRGRIYRVVPSAQAPRPVPRLDGLSTAELAAALDSPSGRWRDTAQRLLLHQHDPESIPALRHILESSPNPLARLHALCTLDGLGAIDAFTVEQALSDADVTVQRHGIRVAEKLLEKGAATRIVARLAQLADQSDPHLRLQLANSLGFSPNAAAVDMLAKLAIESGDDEFLRAAIVSSLNGTSLSRFYHRISNHHGTVVAFRIALVEMASSVEDGQLITELFSDLVADVNPDNLDLRELTKLSEAIRVCRNPATTISGKTKLSIDGISATMVDIANSEDASLSDRVAAIRFVAVSPSDCARSCFGELVSSMSARQPLELQHAITESLSRESSDQLVSGLLSRFPNLSPSVRNRVLSQMLSRESWTRILVSRITDGTIRSGDIGAGYRQALLTRNDEWVRGEAKRLFGFDNVITDKADLVSRYRFQLSAAANSMKGKAVFEKQCVACHVIGDAVRIVGPDLRALKTWSPNDRLTAILDPNRAVENKYQSYNVLTIDGQIISGIIIEESTTAITFQMQAGKRAVVRRNEIEKITSTGKSLMPEGMEELISPKDMSDLLAYLAEIAAQN